jgi:hypothetical protein
MKDKVGTRVNHDNLHPSAFILNKKAAQSSQAARDVNRSLRTLIHQQIAAAVSLKRLQRLLQNPSSFLIQSEPHVRVLVDLRSR